MAMVQKIRLKITVIETNMIFPIVLIFFARSMGESSFFELMGIILDGINAEILASVPRVITQLFILQMRHSPDLTVLLFGFESAIVCQT